MAAPRTYVVARWVGTIVIAALGVVTIAGLVASGASVAGKALGAVVVGLLMGGAGIRIWMASRPYGQGDRDASG